ncbi:hypothetical protein OHC33_009520 [Knufia fluminis]|uniref:Uncharacterized protein n=1 Tax=Knufia fluminis TaxID=191047 RepID=A0AAN8EFJ3_9EURO|nr:hypothetical protein OHC33_009520 [Knufia fluminis]
MGQLTLEALRLKGKALECLRMAISSADQNWTYSDIGAIMILRGDAYKWNDPGCHQAHTQGLSRIAHGGQKVSRLTPMAERAVFWQDVTAALLFDSKHFTPRLAPLPVQWRREGPQGHRRTPKGFLEHRDVISHGLLDCIEDIVELQEIILSNSDRAVDFFKVDNMQASIESRLAYQCPTANALSLTAECCRLAAFITCFLSFTETWDNVLVPCKLSDKLHVLLYNSLEDPVWVQHRALQIWLLLVGSCTASLDHGHVEGLKGKWDETLDRFTKYSVKLLEPDMNKEALISALQDFIYCGDWLRKRQEVRGWVVLEMALGLQRPSELQKSDLFHSAASAEPRGTTAMLSSP